MTILRINKSVRALLMYSALVLGRGFVRPIREPVVSLVRNDTVSLLIIIASSARRCLGYVEIVVIEKTDLQSLATSIGHFEDPDQSVLVRQNKISRLYLYTFRVRKTCFENSAIRKKSLFPYPRIISQPAERFVAVSPDQDPWKGSANVLRIIVARPEEMTPLPVLPNCDKGWTGPPLSLLAGPKHLPMLFKHDPGASKSK